MAMGSEEGLAVGLWVLGLEEESKNRRLWTIQGGVRDGFAWKRVYRGIGDVLKVANGVQPCEVA